MLVKLLSSRFPSGVRWVQASGLLFLPPYFGPLGWQELLITSIFTPALLNYFWSCISGSIMAKAAAHTSVQTICPPVCFLAGSRSAPKGPFVEGKLVAWTDEPQRSVWNVAPYSKTSFLEFCPHLFFLCLTGSQMQTSRPEHNKQTNQISLAGNSTTEVWLHKKWLPSFFPP